MKRLDIKISFHCNNHCRHCVQGRKRTLSRYRPTRVLKEMMLRSRSDCDEIVFTGGEPTVNDDFLECVRYAKKAGYRSVQVQTNGRLFAYKDFAQAVYAAGVDEFVVALHGPTPPVHDFLTRVPGSFWQTVAGIRNLKALGGRVISNSVITKPNYRLLPEIAELLVSLDVDQLQFAYVHILGSARENYRSIVPRVELLVPFMRRAVALGRHHRKNTYVEAVPLCCLKGFEACASEAYMPETRIFDERGFTPDFAHVRRAEGKAKDARCRRCVHDSVCEGPWKEYAALFGWKEFIPVERPPAETPGRNTAKRRRRG